MPSTPPRQFDCHAGMMPLPKLRHGQLVPVPYCLHPFGRAFGWMVAQRPPSVVDFLDYVGETVAASNKGTSEPHRVRRRDIVSHKITDRGVVGPSKELVEGLHPRNRVLALQGGDKVVPDRVC